MLDMRRTNYIETIWNDLRYAVRTLARNPGSSTDLSTLRCPLPPRKVRWLLLPVASPTVLSGFILVGGLATFVFLSRPNRVHLRYGSRVRLPTRPPHY